MHQIRSVHGINTLERLTCLRCNETSYRGHENDAAWSTEAGHLTPRSLRCIQYAFQANINNLKASTQYD